MPDPSAACDCPTCTEAAARPGMAQVTHVESAAQGQRDIPREGCSFMRTVDDLLIDVLGKWCSRCQRVTEPYVGETNEWPCCNGCWRVYPDA